MNRVAPVYDNAFYHVYNRGNRKQPIFGDRSDYLSCIDKLRSGCERYQVRIDVFCLMPNHFHLIAMQLAGGSIPRFMDSVETSAAKRYNLKYDKVGHLFQGRYRYSQISSDYSILNVARYIHLNPVEAKLVSSPEKWPYSDFRDFIAAARKEASAPSPPVIDWKKYPSVFPSTKTDYVQSVWKRLEEW